MLVEKQEEIHLDKLHLLKLSHIQNNRNIRAFMMIQLRLKNLKIIIFFLTLIMFLKIIIENTQKNNY